ncbi:hypothetical protein B0F90DRAFT_1918222 [Multifurca ochricompacta]|uniref:Uncharacterized protein n=1 Tax=Multifurca ochricompacta TaxID=376703 RepID=A0AAD4M2P2_9AGAM|nr:hypothetical protein B0F90DRAFT_1918759 [Multifurca ochricompacta]KAI0299077.1 hypothetical protein B0F90DRAFT_1918222 [Multifurca ochricompacta]
MVKRTRKPVSSDPPGGEGVLRKGYGLILCRTTNRKRAMIAATKMERADLRTRPNILPLANSLGGAKGKKYVAPRQRLNEGVCSPAFEHSSLQGKWGWWADTSRHLCFVLFTFTMIDIGISRKLPLMIHGDDSIPANNFAGLRKPGRVCE